MREEIIKIVCDICNKTIHNRENVYELNMNLLGLAVYTNKGGFNYKDVCESCRDDIYQEIKKLEG